MSSPLTVAIIGTGPAGFYAAEHLLKQAPPPATRIDLFDRLPTPFGLVRGGVAPDHQKIKTVTKVYERIGATSGVRFFGHVEVGADLSREELRRHYHAVIYAVGAQSDRHLGIPGESLPGSHAATEFVGWYNGHPDYRNCVFDLSQDAAVVIGVGNVAVDVVRVLARTSDELARTDIAPYALEQLAESRIRDIYMIGRRGPVQAAFTHPEMKELGELPGADVVVHKEEIELDPASAKALAESHDKTPERNLLSLREFAGRQPGAKAKRLHIRFLLSPLALEGGGRVDRVRLGRNRLVAGANGDLRAESTGQEVTIPAGLVFRSVGYLGTGVPGLPLDARRGIIPNDRGRVLDGAAGAAPGEYVVGWIKRGPTGVIGTNKPDGVETGDLVLEDFAAGRLADPEPVEGIERLLQERGVRPVRWEDWRRLDELERSRGAPLGRPRLKFTTVEEMLDALNR